MTLSQKLGKKVRRLYTDGSGTFVAKANSVVLNWGNGTAPGIPNLNGVFRVLNPFDKVKVASNKLHTFNYLLQHNNLVPDQLIPYPPFTADRAMAVEWVNNGAVVVCRTKLTGHSGEGIVVAAREEDLPTNCPLFVKYMKKKKEFRVHVAFGQAVDVQQKRRRTDYTEEPNFAIRNYHTGWVYCREDIVEPTGLREFAVTAVNCLGLDFGAVDIIWNEHNNQCYVLEVNTAPGLEGTTIENYANTIYQYLRTNNLAR